jgi:hypothetical protein
MVGGSGGLAASWTRLRGRQLWSGSSFGSWEGMSRIWSSTIRRSAVTGRRTPA